MSSRIEKTRALNREYACLNMNVKERSKEEEAFIENVERGMSYIRAARKAHFELPKGVEERPWYLGEGEELNMGLSAFIKIASAIIAFFIVYAFGMDFSFKSCFIAVLIYLALSYVTIGAILVKSGVIKDPVEKLKEDAEKEIKEDV